MKQRLKWVALVAAIIVPVLALAQAVPDPSVDPFAFLKAFVTAITSGQWPVVLALSLVLAVFLVRKIATLVPKVGEFFATSAGGTLLSLFSSFAIGLGGAVLAGQPLSWKLVGIVTAGAFGAIGGWTAVRRIIPLLGMVPYIGPVVKWLVPDEDLHATIQAETKAAFAPAAPSATAAAAALVAPVAEKPAPGSAATQTRGFATVRVLMFMAVAGLLLCASAALADDAQPTAGWRSASGQHTLRPLLSANLVGYDFTHKEATGGLDVGALYEYRYREVVGFAAGLAFKVGTPSQISVTGLLTGPDILPNTGPAVGVTWRGIGADHAWILTSGFVFRFP